VLYFSGQVHVQRVWEAVAGTEAGSGVIGTNMIGGKTHVVQTSSHDPVFLLVRLKVTGNVTVAQVNVGSLATNITSLTMTWIYSYFESIEPAASQVTAVSIFLVPPNTACVWMSCCLKVNSAIWIVEV